VHLLRQLRFFAGRGTRERDGGGVLLTQAIHALDLFRSLVGVSAVQAAQATTTAVHRMETEDYAAALLRLGHGAPGLLMATTALYPGSPEVLEVAGTLGAASLAAGRLQVRWHDGREDSVEAAGPGGSGAAIEGGGKFQHNERPTSRTVVKIRSQLA
jgi:predicted dehydrogenase